MKFIKILSFTIALIILMSCFVFAIPASAAMYGYLIPPEDDFSEKIVYEVNGAFYCVSFGSACNPSYEAGELTLSIKIPYASFSYTPYVWIAEEESWEIAIPSLTGDVTTITPDSAVTILCDRLIYSSVDGLIEAVDVSNHTSVLEDLLSDSSFKLADYPSDASDYSLKVIQIAEGINNELFVYVYNPSDSNVEVEAAYVNMSMQHYEDSEQNYKLYGLTLVSTSGTLDKFIVDGITASDDDCRYYNIAAIYTPFNDDIHEDNELDDNLINYVASPVGLCFEAIDSEDTVVYGCKEIGYVDVDVNDHGIVRFQDSFGFFEDNNTDSHYIAISINNFDVTKIYDVSMSFYTQSYYYHYDSLFPLEVTENYGDPIFNEIDVSYAQRAQNEGGGFLGSSFMSYDYSWERIMSAAEYLAFLSDCENEELIDYDSDLISYI